jgi:hemoglobin-like flavoprotein
MNDHTIALVKESLDLVEPIAGQAGAMFLANLRDADPSFTLPADADPQVLGATLMQQVQQAVGQLGTPQSLAPLLGAFGRGAGAAIGDARCNTVRAAWLKTLWQVLGVAYNAEVEAAWVEVHEELVAGAKEATAVPA